MSTLFLSPAFFELTALTVGLRWTTAVSPPAMAAAERPADIADAGENRPSIGVNGYGRSGEYHGTQTLFAGAGNLPVADRAVPVAPSLRPAQLVVCRTPAGRFDTTLAVLDAPNFPIGTLPTVVSKLIALKPEIPCNTWFGKLQETSQSFKTYLQEHCDDLSDREWVVFVTQISRLFGESNLTRPLLYEAVFYRKNSGETTAAFLDRAQTFKGLDQTLVADLATAVLTRSKMGLGDFERVLGLITEPRSGSGRESDLGHRLGMVVHRNPHLTAEQLEKLRARLLTSPGRHSDPVVFGLGLARIGSHPNYPSEARRSDLVSLRTDVAWPTVESFVMVLALLTINDPDLRTIPDQLVAYLEGHGVHLDPRRMHERRATYGTNIKRTTVWQLIDAFLSPTESDIGSMVA